MSQQNKTPFQKISSLETTSLLALLHKHRVTVQFKMSDTGVYKAKAENKGWGQNILIRRPANLGQDRKDSEVTGNFTLDSQIYFFKAILRLQKKQIHLQLNGELNKLVRRRQDRVVVPERVPLHLMTKRIGDQLLFVRGGLQDISIKGCKVVLNTSEVKLKVGDILTGVLRFGQRKPISVTAVVRHHQKIKHIRYDQMFGVEYTKLDDLLRLQAWIIDVQRENFNTLGT
jgi:hypothetical protein